MDKFLWTRQSFAWERKTVNRNLLIYMSFNLARNLHLASVRLPVPVWNGSELKLVALYMTGKCQVFSLLGGL